MKLRTRNKVIKVNSTPQTPTGTHTINKRKHSTEWVTCGMCGHYIKRKTRADGVPICRESTKPVDKLDRACPKVELMNFFWCRKNEQYVHHLACMRRREEREEGCPKCKQGKGLYEYLTREGLK